MCFLHTKRVQVRLRGPFTAQSEGRIFFVFWNLLYPSVGPVSFPLCIIEDKHFLTALIPIGHYFDYAYF